MSLDAVPHRPRIRELLRVYPGMPATVIAERIGWDRGLTVLKERPTSSAPSGGIVGRSGGTIPIRCRSGHQRSIL